MKLFFAAFLLLISVSGAMALDRVALVVGNGSYSSVPALANPERDAQAIGATLSRIGFEVILGVDLPIDEMRDAIRRFSLASETADVALFYYAGHGMQVAGKNYLLPVDAVIERESDLDFAAVSLDLIVRQLDRSGGRKVIFLDACRDNPFETRLSRSMGQSRSAAVLGRGLAQVETDGGSFIGFATDPGEVAFDGQGEHSPFTDALLRHIETPGLEINAMMTRVRAEVFEGTDRLQRPWSTSSLLDELYLALPEEPAPVAGDNVLAEVEAWRAAQQGSDLDAVRAYLETYPDGLFADLARTRLNEPDPVPDAEIAALRPETVPKPPLRAADPVAEPRERDCEACPRMVAVPGGQFLMGNSAPDAPAAERPATVVDIAAFEVSEAEITVSEFRNFVQSAGHSTGQGCFVWTEDGRMRRRRDAGFEAPGYPADPNMPAACVNWQDAVAYTEWLSRETGRIYRLPSEAELEYAIRAGSSGPYPWEGGPASICSFVNGADAGSAFRWRNTACADGARFPVASGQFPRNSFGLSATIGNLWEWAADCWNASHRGAPSSGQARTNGQCASRVLRGGSWDDPVENLRASYRVGIPADRRQANVGFRVVREISRIAR